MASKFARKCWKIGIPLNEAWEAFAPQQLREEYAQLPGFAETFAENVIPDELLSGLNALQAATQASSRRLQFEAELKESLLTELSNNQLVAVGFREFPTIGQSPVRIDPNRFEDGEPDWRADTFENHGVRYGRIRICDPDELDQADKRNRAKGSKLAIELAIDQLISSDSEFCNLPRKAACQKVRDYLGQTEIKGNGLGDINISKAIVSKCGKKGISPNSN